MTRSERLARNAPPKPREVYTSIRVFYEKDLDSSEVGHGDIWVNNEGVVYIKTLSGWYKLSYCAEEFLTVVTPEDEHYVRRSLGLKRKVKL